jgi:hypothetical protein
MRNRHSPIIFVTAICISWPVFAADTANQPLNRADCDKAGMRWNDNANVCAANEPGSPQAVLPKAESQATSKPAMTKPSKKTTMPSKEKNQVFAKKSSSRKHATYKKQEMRAPTKPAKQGPLHWLFPKARKKAGAS